MLHNFLWRNKTHYLRKSVTLSSYDKGGLNFIDFDALNNTFKINWIKKYLKNPTSIWNFISHHLFSNLGGLNFLLLCNYSIPKIPLKLSHFHQQVLLAWTLIYKHNFSPQSCFIWNNCNIVYKNPHSSLHFGLFIELEKVAQIYHFITWLFSLPKK